MNCIHCSAEIPAGRLKALPKTRTCTECSTSPRVAGFQVTSEDSEYSELHILSQEQVERLNRLQERDVAGKPTHLNPENEE